MKKLVLNKKKSVVLSIIIPNLFTILFVIGYSFIPEFEEEQMRIVKSIWSLIPIFSLILSCSMFWATLFFAKPKFYKNEIDLDRKKYIKNSFLSYIIISVILICFLILAPTNDDLTLEYVSYMKGNLILVIFVSIINSIIEISCILFGSIQKENKNRSKKELKNG